MMNSNAIAPTAARATYNASDAVLIPPTERGLPVAVASNGCSLTENIDATCNTFEKSPKQCIITVLADQRRHAPKMA